MKYVIGHKSPDTDTVVSAIAYAIFKGDDYKPAISGNLNEETKFVLEKFGFETPELLKEAGDNEFVLVDHNEESQRLKGLGSDKVLEIIDHHKVNFSSSKPIPVTVEPYGSTATIIAEMFLKGDRDIDENLAGLFLSAILSDTVIFKSPTTSQKDREIAEIMSDISGIEDMEAFGKELFEKKAQISSKTAEEIIFSDFKDFQFGDKKVGVGQIELADTENVKPRKQEILDKMEELVKEGGYFGIILMVSDIIKGGSYLWIAGNSEKIEKMFEMGKDKFLEGVLSRKKQVTPVLEEKLDK